MNDVPPLLVRGLAALGIEREPRTIDTLQRYLDELERWNPAYGLVNASGDELVIKHILDSLAPWRLLEQMLEGCDRERAARGLEGRAAVSDIGTGAGLPGIPLSVIMPARRFRLVERMGKRISFLESQKAILPLENVEIVESEVERAPGPHDLVIFRAFRPFTELKLFKALWKNLAPGGLFFAYKGKPFNAKIELAALATDPLLSGPFSKAAIEPVWVPFLEEERCIVVVRKPLQD
mgnify:FL=1